MKGLEGFEAYHAFDFKKEGKCQRCGTVGPVFGHKFVQDNEEVFTEYLCSSCFKNVSVCIQDRENGYEGTEMGLDDHSGSL